MSPNEKMKQIRINQKKTTYELSELTGIPQSTISKMENGKRKIETESLQKIAKALDVSINTFFEDDLAEKESRDYFFEQYLGKLGFEIIYDDVDGYLILDTPDAQYEVSPTDLDNLQDNVESFIRFKISEVTNNLRKFPKE